MAENSNQVVLTVGTNPLPVLVAAWRLASCLKPKALYLLHSRESQPMAQVIKEHLNAKWDAQRAPKVPVQLVEVESATQPGSIFHKVRQMITGDGCKWHLHYTGGTKTMGMKAMQAFAARKDVSLADSYLDVNHHAVLNERGICVDSAVTDERREWNLGIRELCSLHGMTVDFRLSHRYRIHGKMTGCIACFGQATPEQSDIQYSSNGQPLDLEWEGIGADAFDVLCQGERGAQEIAEFKSTLNKNWPESQDRWPRLPSEPVRKAVIWPTSGASDQSYAEKWAALPSRMNKIMKEIEWDAANKLVKHNGPTGSADLARLLHLADGGDLECAAHKGLREALAAQCLNGSRWPFSIFHSTRVARQPPPKALTVPHCFELDIVAILGYQAVVVSCTRGSQEKSRASVKNKAFEAFHRARQIGGDGARALVISGLEADAAKDLEEELHDETGLTGELISGSDVPKPLRIWPGNSWPKLRQEFEKYLARDLKWGN